MGLRKALEKKFRDKVQKKEHKQVKPKIPRGAMVKDGMLMVPDSFTKSGKIRGGKILSSMVPRKKREGKRPTGKRTNFKNGGFPDLSGDGKITQKDILMGRGVIKKAGGGSAMPGMKKRVMAKRGKSITKKRVKKKTKRTMKRGGGMAMANRPMRRGGGMMKKNMM